ncbi:lipid A export permease/ATP-binding protein MsbA [Bacterioplanes sanyensis]|uniref:Lipid A export permease/ATP-binding protein MsbA n=1 Tax=Bacterioplanes sanyensis TaxID=1249553 RepID=A0A222FMS7_9GAMM|nr:lipid A export permease/ATP-binding protein MsbA [Bacterioplanes sanyensis]ASP39982.1 lipid A export permease/ATP-binding protein MsbA [Bacterioplanes sanyensis]
MDNQSTWAVYRRLLRYAWPYKGSLFVSVMGFALFAAMTAMIAKLTGKIIAAVDSHDAAGEMVEVAPVVDQSADSFKALQQLDESVFQPVADFFFTYVEQPLLNVFEQYVDQPLALLLVLSLSATFLGRGVGTFFGKYYIAVVARGVVHDLRTNLFDQMTRLPSRYYDGESSGTLIARVIFNVEQVTSACTRAITILVQDGLSVICLMAYMFYLDASLTYTFLVLVPIIGVVVALASRLFRRYSRRIQDSMSEVAQVTNETITGYREVRTFGGETFERQRLNKASHYNQKQTLKLALTNAINVPLNQQIVAIGLSVMVYFMFQRLASGAMNNEEFISFLTAASLIAKPVRSLTDINSIIQKGIAAAQSVFTVLDADPEPDNGQYVADTVRGKLQFHKVSFGYPNTEKKALDGIDIDIQAGETIALVGASGSGKTTLVNLIPRFYQYSAGQILLDGVDINDYTLANLRSHIAIVSQSVTLFNASVRDNIAYGELADCSQEQIEAAAKAACAHEFILALPQGYDTPVGEAGSMLSGGQRQRIAMARALLKDAPILILDEATSALDTESERHIQQALEQLMQNRTTLVIAHRLSTIENADRILVMEQGRIVEQGQHQALLAKGGAYERLHRLQYAETTE